MGNISGKDDGDDFKRDETLGAQIRRDMHNDDSKYDPKPVNEEEEENSKKLLKRFENKTSNMVNSWMLNSFLIF